MKIKNLIILFMFAMYSCVYAAAPSVAPKFAKKEVPSKFDFHGIGVAAVVQLIYAEALRTSYVIEPEVLTDMRTVTFRFDGKESELREFVSAFLDNLGLLVTRKGGIDFVARKSSTQPLTALEPQIFLYKPRFRDGAYIVELLGPLFKGSFTSKRSVRTSPGEGASQKVAPIGSAAASIDRKTDMLVFAGSEGEIAQLKAMLPVVDVPVGDVLVRGVLYEVQTTGDEGSAFGLALRLLGGKVGVNLGAIGGRSEQFSLSLKNHTIDAVFSALSTDTRFKAISKPTLRVMSGGTGRFTVGQDVPVLGSVTYPGAGQAPVQSVSYQSSGVIFDLQPVLHDALIDLSVLQQVSNFVVTSTGVNASPTLIKRELKSDLTLSDGEVVVLGGLAEDRVTESSSGLSFLPSFAKQKSANKTSTEILLILQVTRI